MICMWKTWLVMLRQTPETSVGTSTVRKKTPKVFDPEKGECKGRCSGRPRKGRGIQWLVYGCVQ